MGDFGEYFGYFTRTEEIGNSLKFKVEFAVLFVALTRTYSGARKGSGRDKGGGSATYDDDGCGHSDSEIRQSRGTTEKTAHKREAPLALSMNNILPGIRSLRIL